MAKKLDVGAKLLFCNGFFAVLVAVAGVFLKLLIPVIQTFCYHGNVTLHFSLFSQARHVSGVAS